MLRPDSYKDTTFNFNDPQKSLREMADVVPIVNYVAEDKMAYSPGAIHAQLDNTVVTISVPQDLSHIMSGMLTDDILEELSEEDRREFETAIEDMKNIPEKFNSYEYLRDLAYQVIKSAELVEVR